MKLAIVGRPNVGKSTLFNRLVGRKLAIVQDTPGVTRDWRSHPGRLGDLTFEVLDTPGLMGFESDELANQIQANTKSLCQKADVILFVVDGTTDITPGDEELARQINRFGKPVLLVVNKCESSKRLGEINSYYALGLGEPIAISAEHNLGLDDLYQELAPLITEPHMDDHEEKPLSIAVVGRPNAGKSTFLNAIIGENRLLTGDMPGVTRDSISIPWTYEGRSLSLIDTAGLRRKARITDSLEQMAADDSLKSIQYAEAVVLVLDAESPLDNQDLNIARHVVEEGRILVIALNKMDLVSPKIIRGLELDLGEQLSQAKGVALVPISAIKKTGLSDVMDAIFLMEERWNARISTSKLNMWLGDALERHPTPLVGNNRIRIKYMTQLKSRPPTFALFISRPAELPGSYLRYLQNDLREAFDLGGVPIRFVVKKGKNPYVDKG